MTRQEELATIVQMIVDNAKSARPRDLCDWAALEILALRESLRELEQKGMIMDLTSIESSSNLEAENTPHEGEDDD